MTDTQYDDPRVLLPIERSIREAIVLPSRPLPDDTDKTDDDWQEDDVRSKGRQDAFQRNHIEATRYLDVTKGGQQTSRDAHMVCQGMALVMDAATRFHSATIRFQNARLSALTPSDEVVKLREALERYAQHDRDCLSRKGAHYGPESCDCGLNEARTALQETQP